MSLLRRRVARHVSDGILTVSSIGLALRLILRTRLTLNRFYRYLYLHLLFQALQKGSSLTFDAPGMLPYRCYMHPAASATGLIPDYYPCPVPRPVSCYALFE